jgi:hypothetical protein
MSLIITTFFGFFFLPIKKNNSARNIEKSQTYIYFDSVKEKHTYQGDNKWSYYFATTSAIGKVDVLIVEETRKKEEGKTGKQAKALVEMVDRDSKK